ncbi:MAG: hypothetical protein QM642_03130 [Edaphocola sp.]
MKYLFIFKVKSFFTVASFCMLLILSVVGCTKGGDQDAEAGAASKVSTMSAAEPNYYSLDDLVPSPNDSAVLMRIYIRHSGDDCANPNYRYPCCPCPWGLCMCDVDHLAVMTPMALTTVAKEEDFGIAWCYKVDDSHIRLIFNQQTALLDTNIVPVTGNPYELNLDQSELLGFDHKVVIVPGNYVADTTGYVFGSILLNLQN